MPEIQNICDKCDIVLLQETWLRESELVMLSSLHVDFSGRGVSSMDSTQGMHKGRPYGGLAILWRKALGHLCRIDLVDPDNRLFAIEIECAGKRLSILNVYLPYDDGSNMDEYQQYLNQISGFIDMNPYSCAFGDFNANTRQMSHFGRTLVDFCNDENLILSDTAMCDSNSFTFISEAQGHSVSWLDHVLTTHTIHARIKNIRVGYEYVTSDHFPIFTELSIQGSELNSDQRSENTKDVMPGIRWSEMKAEDLELYKTTSEQCMAGIKLDHSLMLCEDIQCQDTSHIAKIDELYEAITTSLHSASTMFRVRKSAKFKPKQVLGWNDVCSELHAHARSAFLLWRANNSPRHGPIFDIMRTSRARFKLALRQCRKDHDKHAADKLAEKLMTDQKDFWKEVKRTKSSTSAPLAETVEGKTDVRDIAEMWRHHFEALLNSSEVKAPPANFSNINSAFSRVSVSEVHNAINGLKYGKSCGHDKIFGEHLKNAHDNISVYLSLLFNALIVHNYVPHDFMVTVLLPIVKDNKGDLSSCDNYRPIALTTIISKVFERVILNRYSDIVLTTGNQFGFKPKHSTEECVFVFKQVLDFYNSNSSPIYATFLDLSKAFDRVNHNILFSKLLEKGIHPLIVRILNTWYVTQTFVVKWGSAISSCFHVTNGTRQGSILSPVMFNLYIDELSIRLNQLRVGCYINGTCFNHLIYADDTVLIAPSPTALQCLIDVCIEFVNNNDLKLNATKSKYMVFRTEIVNGFEPPQVFVNDIPIPRVSDLKYLGVTICEDCTDDISILKCIRGTYTRGNMIRSCFKDCSMEVKLRLFRSYCSSFYCCALWHTYKGDVYRKVKVSHNNVFRFIVKCDRRGSISRQFVLHSVNNFDVIRRKLVYSLYKRILTSSNKLIATVLSMSYFIFSKLFKSWLSVLF